MTITILSALQVILVIVLVILVLLQPHGNSSLSGFSSSHGWLSSMIPRTSMNPVNKATALIVGLFIVNTLLLSGLSSKDMHKRSVTEKILLERKQEEALTSVPFEN